MNVKIDGRLAGKVAIVSGGAGGCGGAASELFAAQARRSRSSTATATPPTRLRRGCAVRACKRSAWAPTCRNRPKSSRP